ncbi:GntR family transcriptional regulator [Neobacillus muris]|uniref:GntR family transcriptional regulator n=1 Tax=Neobacillus muris TaxID=2941334 RepID=UPI00204182F0|nr:GntR family transcriptional regulator [Neobacillus muris]
MLLNHQTLSDSVASIIRKMIFNGTLKPGERINQVQLAEKMDISRGPIREALRLLQNEGLIKHETNKGTFVTTLSRQDQVEIYTLRALLEGEAAKLASKQLTPSDYHELEELVESFRKFTLEEDLENLAKIDLEFHKKIVSKCGNARLIKFHQQLDTQVGAMFLTVANIVPVRINQLVDNHIYLIEALKGQNEERIKQVFSEHYKNTLKDLRNN